MILDIREQTNQSTSAYDRSRLCSTGNHDRISPLEWKLCKPHQFHLKMHHFSIKMYLFRSTARKLKLSTALAYCSHIYNQTSQQSHAIRKRKPYKYHQTENSDKHSYGKKFFKEKLLLQNPINEQSKSIGKSNNRICEPSKPQKFRN